MLASLRGAYPDAEIDWLVQRGFEDAVGHHPGLSRAIPFDRRRFGRVGNASGLIGWLRELRSHQYDLVVDAQGLLRSGLIALATGAPRRVGHADARELGWLPLTQRVPTSAAHAVERMMSLIDGIGLSRVEDMRLFTSEADRAAVLKQWPQLGHGRFVVIAPTSRWAAKRWPIERFDEVTHSLLDEGLTDSVFIAGGPGEEPQCAPLLARAERDPRVLNGVGKTSVGQLMAVIERASLVIANDSAAVHMAVGFDRRIVALYGPTDIARVGPYQRDSDVIQHLRPGDRVAHKDDAQVALMERISTNEVVEAARARVADH